MNGICEFCKNEIDGEEFFVVHCLVVDTDKDTQYIGLRKVSEDISNYLMDKSYHLSATQVLLFRPDIVKEFLETRYIDRKIFAFKFKPYLICYECFEEWKELMPLV